MESIKELREKSNAASVLLVLNQNYQNALDEEINAREVLSECTRVRVKAQDELSQISGLGAVPKDDPIVDEVSSDNEPDFYTIENQSHPFKPGVEHHKFFTIPTKAKVDILNKLSEGTFGEDEVFNSMMFLHLLGFKGKDWVHIPSTTVQGNLHRAPNTNVLFEKLVSDYVEKRKGYDKDKEGNSVGRFYFEFRFKPEFLEMTTAYLRPNSPRHERGSRRLWCINQCNKLPETEREVNSILSDDHRKNPDKI